MIFIINLDLFVDELHNLFQRCMLTNYIYGLNIEPSKRLGGAGRAMGRESPPFGTADGQ